MNDPEKKPAALRGKPSYRTSIYPPLPGPVDYGSTAEAAQYLRVSKQVISNWRRRYLDMPPPVADLAMGPVWHLCELRDWARRRGIWTTTAAS